MKRHYTSAMIMMLASLLIVGCAQKAEQKLADAGHDLAAAWAAERDAAVEAMKNGIEATDRRIEKARARAAELEAEGEAEVAKLWHRTADELGEIRDAAANEVAALEDAGADAWESTKHVAADTVEGLERAGARVAAFAAEARDDFVAEARAVVDASELELARAKEKLAEAGEEATEEWHEAVEALEKKHRAAVAELEKIERAEGEAWGDMRHGFVAAYHDLRDASERASERLGEI